LLTTKRNNQAQLAFDDILSETTPQLNPEPDEPYYDNPTDFESFPSSLVLDFEKFVNYVEKHTVHLTKGKGHISRKHLQAINNVLSVKNQEATSNTDQEYYFYIHFFYHLVISARLFDKVPAKGGKYVLKETDRLLLFKELNPLEKYFFLLETFWVDLNWIHILDESNPSFVIAHNDLFSELSGKKRGEKVSLLGNSLIDPLRGQGFILLYCEWFGLMKTKVNQRLMERINRKGDYFVESVTPTDLGVKMIPLLLIERNLSLWNKAVRKFDGELNPIPGLLEREYITLGFEMPQEVEDAIESRMEEDQSDQPFFEPFTKLFPNHSLKQTLPRNKTTFMKGTYTIKVYYSNMAWIKIMIAGTNTMEDLHHTIIQAFQFDDDHLYSFFIDGEKWSNDCVVSPEDNFGHPQADLVQFGELGLEVGQSFVYLYDYGDEWTFRIKIEHYDEHSMEL